MRDVDYMKLSELYAGFLIAIGGVSITVLSIVSAIGSDTKKTQTEELASSFLGAALIVATVSCFIGAHMMAETAAFIRHFREELTKAQPMKINTPRWGTEEWTPSVAIKFGKRLFLLATTNIFVSVILVLFAIVLLPAAKGTARNILPIYFMIFALVGGGTLYWMYLASKFRVPVNKSWIPITFSGVAGLVWGFGFGFGIKFPGVAIDPNSPTTGCLLLITFTPIVLFIVTALVYFASIFKRGNQARRPRFVIRRRLNNFFPRLYKDGSKARNPEVSRFDIGLFGCAVTISYASLIVASVKLLLY
jgi:hypothetical protein